jgi:hypothetical protein
MPDNPITRLTFIRDEVDRTFGEGYSAAHPDIVCAMLASAASDHAAFILAHALSDIAAALVVDDSDNVVDHGLVRAPASLLRP